MADDAVYTVSPAITAETTPDYSLGDVLGGKLILKGLGSRCNNGGILCGCRIVSDTVNAVTFYVTFFNADPAATAFTENGGLTVALADQPKVIGTAVLSTIADIGGATVHSHDRLLLPFPKITGEMYAVIVPQGTLNINAATDIHLSVSAVPA